MIEWNIVIKGLIIGCSFIIGLGSGYWFGHDNVIEEIAEEIIKDQIGINIDITPGSDEGECNGNAK